MPAAATARQYCGAFGGTRPAGSRGEAALARRTSHRITENGENLRAAGRLLTGR
jgi:hypothetical protein